MEQWTSKNIVKDKILGFLFTLYISKKYIRFPKDLVFFYSPKKGGLGLFTSKDFLGFYTLFLFRCLS